MKFLMHLLALVLMPILGSAQDITVRVSETDSAIALTPQDFTELDSLSYTLTPVGINKIWKYDVKGNITNVHIKCGNFTLVGYMKSCYMQAQYNVKGAKFCIVYDAINHKVLPIPKLTAEVKEWDDIYMFRA